MTGPMRWIVGDVHGMRAPLERLLEEVGRLDGSARFAQLKGLSKSILRRPNGKWSASRRASRNLGGGAKPCKGMII